MKRLEWKEGCIELDTRTTQADHISIYRLEDGKTYLRIKSNDVDEEIDAHVCLENLLSEIIEKGYLAIGLNIQ
jgi:hypothetical protein